MVVRLTIIFFVALSSLGLVRAQPNLDSIKAVVGTLESDSVRVMTYIELVVLYKRINYDSAFKYVQKAEQLSKEIGSMPLLAKSKYRKATVYISKDQETLAKTELDTTIMLSIEAGDSTTLLSAKIDQGRLSEKYSKYDQAVKELFDALQLAKSLDHKEAQARIKNYLASIYHFQLQYDLAIRYFKDALVLVRELNFKPGISAILTNLGETYSRVQNYDSAKRYQQEALQIKEELGDKLGLGRVYNNLANTFIDSNSPYLDSSLFYYNKGLTIALEMKDAQLSGLSLYGKVRANLIKGHLTEARLAADQLIDVLDSLQDLSLASDSYDQISLVYAALGDIKKALAFKAMSDVLTDSLLSSERAEISQELEAKYQNQENQRAIGLLESENKLQELNITKSRNERNGLIVLSITILLALGLLINQYRSKQKANQKLQELDRMRTSFFENLSHEFRTPLTLIMAPLKERMISADTEEKKVLHLVLKNAEKLLKLINELLDLAKLEAGAFEIHKSSVEVSHFFKVLAASYDSYASSKSILFHVHLLEQETWLMLDQEIISKVCNNLLSNAFKFTPEGGEVSFHTTYKDGILQIRVTDNGVGIPASDQEKIFNRFEQGERSGKLQQGTGIGLALVKELTEAHGGEVVLESTGSAGNNGATFSLSIPAEKGIPQNEVELSTKKLLDTEVAVQPDEAGYSENENKILVIEDNDELREYISKLLSNSYQVLSAVNGREGLKIAIDQIPNLIISDVMMPEMDGLELCENLNENEETNHIPIILLTARVDKQTKISGLQLGAIQYMTKPFEPEELKITIDNIIEHQKKLQDRYLMSGSTAKKHNIHPFIEKCESIVMDHLDNTEFDISLFAREVGMSRMQLHRKLASLTNLSSTAFIRHFRLTRAKELLEKGEHTSQVAYAVGFSSLSYFSTSFKKQFGKSPSEYSPSS